MEINNKGQVAIIKWMTAMALLFLTIGFIDPFKDNVLSARSSLQCATNTSLSVGTQILCLGLDTTLWYFLGAMFFLAVGVMWDKKQSS